MDSNKPGKRIASPAAISSEVARVEEMLVALTEQIDSASGKLKSSIQLQIYRAELRAYWAGLLFTLGHTDLLETRRVCPELNIAGAPPVDAAGERRKESARFN